MTKRDFNKHLNACSKKGKLDMDKLLLLPESVRSDMVLFIVRNRGPVLMELLTGQIDRSWLAACGYLYQTRSKQTGLAFVHMCAHKIL